MIRRLFLVLFCTMAILFPIAGFSQEETNFTQEEDLSEDRDVEYGYVTVIKVKKDSNELIVREHDWELNEEREVAYSVDADAVIENMDSWKNIPGGAFIDIEYVTDENGKRTINYINVYEPEIEESEME